MGDGRKPGGGGGAAPREIGTGANSTGKPPQLRSVLVRR